ncbi:hypothetical protein [Microcystis aeruginosa]|nr:hypothetical protein [Microcystis aeruginosa]
MPMLSPDVRVIVPDYGHYQLGRLLPLTATLETVISTSLENFSNP